MNPADGVVVPGAFGKDAFAGQTPVVTLFAAAAKPGRLSAYDVVAIEARHRWESNRAARRTGRTTSRTDIEPRSTHSPTASTFETRGARRQLCALAAESV